jgi:hypothetical protein
MPIRINLLAEAQAEEELRRRDPVKRATWMGVFLIFAMLAWSGLILLQTIIARNDLSRSEGHYSARTNDYAQVLANRDQLNKITDKLNWLHKLATDRFLNGDVLNALQQGTVDNVQLLRFSVDQTYAYNAPVKSEGDEQKPAKPGTVREKITLKLEGKDAGPRPGESIDKFKEALARTPYFQGVTSKTNGIRLSSAPSAPQTGPEGKTFVTFMLEFHYPEKTR